MAAPENKQGIVWGTPEGRQAEKGISVHMQGRELPQKQPQGFSASAKLCKKEAKWVLTQHKDLAEP